MNGKMLKEKAVPTAAVALSLVAAFLFPGVLTRRLFLNEREPVTLEVLRENPSASYAGRLPGRMQHTPFIWWMMNGIRNSILPYLLSGSELLFFVLAVSLLLVAEFDGNKFFKLIVVPI